jgi:hypothetical protein
MATVSFPAITRPGRGANQPHPSANVANKLDTHLTLPCVPAEVCQGVTCTFAMFSFLYLFIYIFTYRISHRTHHNSFVSNLKKNDNEGILILVIYWKKTGLLHILVQEGKPFTSSDARSHDLEANFTVSQ